MSDFGYKGRFKVADAHVHLLGEIYLESEDDLARGGLFAGGGMKPLFPNYSGEDLIGEMDKAEISVAVTFPPIWVGGNLIDPNYERHNEVIAHAQAKYPKRIIGFGRVNPNFGRQAVREVERCFAEYGLKGLKLHPDWDQFPADSKLVYPLLEVCQHFNAAVFSHSGGSSSHPMRFLNLAEAFPNLKIVLLHAGYGHISDAVNCAKRVPNLYLETAGQFAFALNAAIRALGHERIMYGSDFPYGPFEMRLSVITTIPGLSDEAKEMILGRNLAGLLGLEEF